MAHDRSAAHPTDEGAPFPNSIKTFPASDRAFAAHVAKVIAAVAQQADLELPSVRLQVALRRSYPNVSVHTQASLARVIQSIELWYVYRDGRIRAHNAQRERLYELLAAARQTTTESADVLERSRAVARRAKF